MNGGPGCSSMLGFAQEHGPYLMPDGQDTFTQTKNPYSWNKIANMLYLEAPAGVGYSFSTKTQPEYTDDSAAEDNYLALEEFFKLFTNYNNNEFYISGESYAGIYVPFLAHKIAVEHAAKTTINLKGILVGNGVTENYYDDESLWAMGFWFGLVDYKLERQMWKGNCYPHELSTETEKTGTRQDQCDAWQGEWLRKIEGVNIYDVYRRCYLPETPAERYGKNHLGNTYKVGMTAQDYTPWLFKSLNDKGIKLEDVSVPCVYAKGTSAYFNRPDVMAVL
jgi:carboxypeptidase C (cathepsin A)